MSEQHKAALVAGRVEARVVRDYLSALREHRPKPGRKRTAESVQNRLRIVERELAKPNADIEDPLRYLEFLQERIDLTAELAEMGSEDVLGRAEAAFVEVAAKYAARKGISYDAWRQMGVPPAVLRKAGLRPGVVGAA